MNLERDILERQLTCKVKISFNHASELLSSRAWRERHANAVVKHILEVVRHNENSNS